MSNRYTYITDEFVFDWHGGAYVEIYSETAEPFDVINVWDYETDKPRIEKSARGLAEVVEEWMIENAS